MLADAIPGKAATIWYFFFACTILEPFQPLFFSFRSRNRVTRVCMQRGYLLIFGQRFRTLRFHESCRRSWKKNIFNFNTRYLLWYYWCGFLVFYQSSNQPLQANLHIINYKKSFVMRARLINRVIKLMELFKYVEHSELYKNSFY